MLRRFTGSISSTLKTSSEYRAGRFRLFTSNADRFQNSLQCPPRTVGSHSAHPQRRSSAYRVDLHRSHRLATSRCDRYASLGPFTVNRFSGVALHCRFNILLTRFQGPSLSSHQIHSCPKAPHAGSGCLHWKYRALESRTDTDGFALILLQVLSPPACRGESDKQIDTRVPPNSVIGRTMLHWPFIRARKKP